MHGNTRIVNNYILVQLNKSVFILYRNTPKGLFQGDILVKTNLFQTLLGPPLEGGARVDVLICALTLVQR